MIDAEQVWQRSDLSGADLPGPLEAASRQRLKESLVAHTHRLAVVRPQSLANFRQADLSGPTRRLPLGLPKNGKVEVGLVLLLLAEKLRRPLPLSD